jgi:hypothetical protein
MKQNMNDFEKRLREAEVNQLEAYQLGIDEAPIMYKQQSGGLVKAETGEPMIFVASEESEDRMGDIIEVNGWKLDDFKKNPVFMFIHQHSVAPLGTVPKVWIEGKQLLNTVKWDDADPLAQFVKGKYERNVMRAVSVGFRPLEFEIVDDKTSKGLFGSYRFKSSELLEISAVPIPAHPKALQRAALTKQFYMSVPDLSFIKEDEPILDEDQNEVYEEIVLGHEERVTEPIDKPEIETEESSDVPVDPVDLPDVDEDESSDELISGLQEIEDLEGRAVSKANRTRITRAIGLLRAVLNNAEEDTPDDSAENGKSSDEEVAEDIVSFDEELVEIDLDVLLQGIRGLKEDEETLTEVEG